MTSFSFLRKNTPYVLEFLFLQFLVVLRNWLTDYWHFYWYCDFSPFVFSFLFFTKNVQAIKGFMYIGLLGQLLYIISFFSATFFNIPLFNFPLPSTWNLYALITLAMHCATLVVLLVLRRFRPHKASLIFSAIFLTIIYFITILTARPGQTLDYNYNYIYSGDILAAMPFYTVLWIPVAFWVAVLPAFLLDTIVFFLSTYKPRAHPPYASLTVRRI